MTTQTLSAVLDTDALRRTAPSVFAARPWHRMSERYHHVPTIEVVDILRDRGFFPVKAVQSRSRIEGKADFTRHMLRFRHADHLARSSVGGGIPELVLSNSHDGTAAYRFAAGIFRLVCSNGLVVATADFGSISVKHAGGKDFGQRVIDATFRIVEDTPRVMDQIEAWKALALPPPVQAAYAEAAHVLLDAPNIAPAQLLEARRPEDRPAEDGSRSLWTTFNAVQEAALKGGVSGRSSTGRRTTTRPVKAVERDLRLNKALWTLAARLAEAIT